MSNKSRNMTLTNFMNDSNILQSQLTPHHSQLLGINHWCKSLCNRQHALGLQKFSSLQVLS